MNFHKNRPFCPFLLPIVVLLLSSVFTLLLFDQAKACHPAFPIGISPYVGPVGVVNPNDWATVKPQLMNHRMKRKGAEDITEEKVEQKREGKAI